MYFLAHTNTVEEDYHHMWDSGGGDVMGLGASFWLLVILAVAALMVAVFLKTSGSNTTGENSPETIVKERYAKGEIDHKEYKELLKELKK